MTKNQGEKGAGVEVAARAFLDKWASLDLNDPWKAEAYMIFEKEAKALEAALNTEAR